MVNIKRCLSILFLVLLTLVSAVATTLAATGKTETLDSFPDIESVRATSIAVDTSGKSHISYIASACNNDDGNCL